jgi:hypothetical protein
MLLPGYYRYSSGFETWQKSVAIYGKTVKGT